MDRRTFLQAAGAAMAGVGGAEAFASLAERKGAGDGGETPQGWWMTEPIRWLQTNLRETDAALEPKAFIADVARFNANVLMMSAGGISAHYPSTVEFAYVSRSLPKGQDTFGEVVREAHAQGIRVVSRWDFSKTHKDVFDAHPEWFFQTAAGEPVVYNGLYSACINGGWSRQKSIEILSEALGRYDVDGCFFNMFSNPTTDYSGRPVGLCHCENCQRIYGERFHKGVPEKADAEYARFMHDSSVSMSMAIRDLMRRLRPKAALVGAAPEIGDIAYGEANTAVKRPLPLWPYTASDSSNQWRNSYPDKGVVCQSMSFVDFPWRFANVPQGEIQTRVWQEVANGGAAAFNVHGTLADQVDRRAIDVLVPAYGWLKEHEEYFVGQRSEARVMLLAPHPGGVGFKMTEDAYRGMFRLLTEQHLPFAAVENLDWLGKREADLVIVAGTAPAGLKGYVEGGGRMLVVSAAEPEFAIAPTVTMWKDPDGAYFRLRDKAIFPSMKETDVVFVYGDYRQVKVEGKSALTFIPPSLYGPPELVQVGWKDTDDPGLVMKAMGKGQVAWLPWDVGGLYFRQSSEAHGRLLSDLIDHLLPDGRQMTTDAHPLVEMTYMRQGERRLVQLVNLSGHSDTAYFQPVPMTGITVRVKGRFTKGKALRSGKTLEIARDGEYARFTLPRLEEYELVELG